MFRGIWIRRLTSLPLAAAVVCLYSTVVLAAPGAAPVKPSGELSASGQVMIDGVTVVSGVTLFSGSTISTAEDSKATVSLGTLGRVQLMPNTSVRLEFSSTGVTGSLDAGALRLSAPAGIPASVTTKDGAAGSVESQPTVFSVGLTGGNTSIAAETGRVEVRAGDYSRELAAGESDTIGQTPQDTTPAPDDNDAAQKAAWVLFGIGAAVATVLIIIAAREGDDDVPSPPNPSPTR